MNCEDEARKCMCEKLNLNKETLAAMNIVRCHRMGGLDGKRRDSRHKQKRPLIVRFNTFKDKSAVWEKRFELAGSEYSLSENILAQQSSIAKNSMPSSKSKTISRITRKKFFLTLSDPGYFRQLTIGGGGL